MHSFCKLAFALVIVAAQSAAAYALHINVDTTDDVVDAGACTAIMVNQLPGPDGFISLREAVCAANNTVGHDQINVPVGTYSLTLGGSGEEDSAEGDLDVKDDLTVRGADRATTIIRNGIGGPALGDGDRIFDVEENSTVELTLIKLTIRDGDRGCTSSGCSTGAAAIDSDGGDLTIDNCSILNNRQSCSGVECGTSSDAETGNSAAIRYAGDGTLRIKNSRVAANRASCTGSMCRTGFGAIVVSSDAAGFEMTSSVVHDNSAKCFDTDCATKAIIDVDDTSATIRGSRITHNVNHCGASSCNGDEVVRLSGAPTLIENSSVRHNASTCAGTDCDTDEVVDCPDNDTVVRNSTVANNETGCDGADCSGDELVDLGSETTLTDFTIENNTLSCSGDRCMMDELLIYKGTATRLRVHDNESSCAGLDCSVGKLVDASDFLNDSAIYANSVTCTGNGCGTSGGALGSGNDSNGLLTVRRSLIADNTNSGRGGGITVGQIETDQHSDESGTFVVINTTISGNSAGDGGGVWVPDDSEITLINVTLAGNESADGANIFNDDGDVTLRNSVVVNRVGGQNCAGSAIFDGGNNFDDDGSCSVTTVAPGTLVDAALADNGGSTRSHALLPGSPALNAIPFADCTDENTDPLTVDQRESMRPADFGCDSGALEMNEGACCVNGAGTDTECLVISRSACESTGGLYLGDDAECGADIECVVLAVTMDTMSATATGTGVRIEWTTAMEIDTVGFRVLREATGRFRGGKAVELVANIAAAGGALEGASYLVVDDAKPAARATRYYLEDIDVYGRVTRHGPIHVERPNRRGVDVERRSR